MRVIFAIIAILSFVSPALAGGPKITMTGQGAVAVRPDLAEISVGVSTEARTAAEALQANAVQMNQVFALLSQQNIDKRDIQTSQFSVHPQWSNQQTSYDKPLEIIGFVATNIVRIRVREIAGLGGVLDALTGAGANRIDSISFSVADPAPYLDEARKRAVADALHKAELFARAAGRALGEIEEISEVQAEAQPMFKVEAMRMMDSSPIAEGEQVISAEITIRWALR